MFQSYVISLKEGLKNSNKITRFLQKVKPQEKTLEEKSDERAIDYDGNSFSNSQ